MEILEGKLRRTMRKSESAVKRERAERLANNQCPLNKRHRTNERERQTAYTKKNERMNNECYTVKAQDV